MRRTFHGMTAPTTPSGSLAAWRIGSAVFYNQLRD